MEEEEKEILIRVDERTERIDKRLDDIKGQVQKNDEAVDTLQDRVSRNTTVLNGLSLGLGSTLTAFISKLAGWFQL